MGATTVIAVANLDNSVNCCKRDLTVLSDKETWLATVAQKPVQMLLTIKIDEMHPSPPLELVLTL